MALINNQYVFVLEESVKRGVSVSTHPVEKGLELTDNVRRNPITIHITGQIVGKNAKKQLENITSLHQNGKYVKYVGQNTLSKGIITSFDTEHPNTIYGGCSFTMDIQEIRVAKSPIAKKKGKKKQVSKKSKNNVNEKTYTIKRGDTLWAIAKKYYGSGAQYTKIMKANKKIKKPNKIQIGWKIKIPA